MKWDLANSYEWASYFGVRFWDLVMDPDGWDRTNLDESLLELISSEEFRHRVMMSTVNVTLFKQVLDRGLSG